MHNHTPKISLDATHLDTITYSIYLSDE